jgi:hypothetical protein
VLPVPLAGRFHHQQISISQVERKSRFTPLTRPKAKISGHAKAEGGDRCLNVEFGLVVCMPAHSISAIAVAIEQQAVEAHAELLLQELAKQRELLGPGMDALMEAAIAVGAARIRHPAGEPGCAVLLAIHHDQGLFPCQSTHQGVPKVLGVETLLLQPGRGVAQQQTRALNPNQGWAEGIP